MRPDGASSQQVQQELQRKYHSTSFFFFLFLPSKEEEPTIYFVMHCCCCFTAEAQVYEKTSLQGVQQLVHRSFQTLALWKLLCDHQFSVIMSELPKVFTQHSLFSKFLFSL